MLARAAAELRADPRSHAAATLPQCSNSRVQPERRDLEVGTLRVLLVEDEPEMAAALVAALKKYDMVVDHISTLADAEEAVSINAYGAILLDRQLPDGDGLTLIPKLRTRRRRRSRDRAHGTWRTGRSRGGAGHRRRRLSRQAVCRRRVAGAVAGGAAPAGGSAVRKPCGLAGCRSISAIAKPASPASRWICRAANFWCWRPCCGAWAAPVARSSLEEAVYSIDDEIQSNALDTHVSRLAPQVVGGAGRR